LCWRQTGDLAASSFGRLFDCCPGLVPHRLGQKYAAATAMVAVVAKLIIVGRCKNQTQNSRFNPGLLENQAAGIDAKRKLACSGSIHRHDPILTFRDPTFLPESGHWAQPELLTLSGSSFAPAEFTPVTQSGPLVVARCLTASRIPAGIRNHDV
jgi:hypothetical protein